MASIHVSASSSNSFLPAICAKATLNGSHIIAVMNAAMQRAISTSRPDLHTSIVARTDHGQAYDYPESVAFQVRDDSVDDYVRAAEFLNVGRFDVVCLQHEFGIFGGDAGADILELTSRLTMPIVTTLHTVLADPSQGQLKVTRRIIEASRPGRKAEPPPWFRLIAIRRSMIAPRWISRACISASIR